jgi:hypothetical protein
MDKITKKNKYKKKITLKNNKKLKQIGGGTEISVLTWNIAWAAMAGITDVDTVISVDCNKTFGKRKTDPYVNDCLLNVVSTIDKIPVLDFVALQESKMWFDIYTRSSKLTQMGYVNSILPYNETSYREEKKFKISMITFYDKSKYKLFLLK